MSMIMMVTIIKLTNAMPLALTATVKTALTIPAMHGSHNSQHLRLWRVHGLETGEEQRRGAGRIAHRLDKAGNGDDWHVLIQRTGTSRSQLHPDVLGDRCFGSNHGLEVRAGAGKLLAAAAAGFHVRPKVLHAHSDDLSCV